MNNKPTRSDLRYALQDEIEWARKRLQEITRKETRLVACDYRWLRFLVGEDVYDCSLVDGKWQVRKQ